MPFGTVSSKNLTLCSDKKMIGLTVAQKIEIIGEIQRVVNWNGLSVKNDIRLNIPINRVPNMQTFAANFICENVYIRHSTACPSL